MTHRSGPPNPAQIAEVTAFGLTCPIREGECQQLLDYIKYGNGIGPADREERIAQLKAERERLLNQSVLFNGRDADITDVLPRAKLEPAMITKRGAKIVGPFVAKLRIRGLTSPERETRFVDSSTLVIPQT